MSVESGLQLLLWLVVVPGCTAALLLWLNKYPKKKGESAPLSRGDKPGAGVPDAGPGKPTVAQIDVQPMVVPTTLPKRAERLVGVEGAPRGASNSSREGEKRQATGSTLPPNSPPITAPTPALHSAAPISPPAAPQPAKPGEPARRRKPKVVLTAAHYARDAGVPGFLYLAKNDAHREHLYKVGYTKGLPQGRIETLNEEAAKAGEIGTFSLVHSVQVGSSFESEQALFDAIADRRIVAKREFFMADKNALRRALDAIARLPHDKAETINDFLAADPWSTSVDIPPAVLAECPIPAKPPGGGWVYVCQNFWHQPGVAVYSVSQEEPSTFLTRMNLPQRTHSSQVGFYRIVACKAVESTEVATRESQTAFASCRIDPRRNFVRGSLDVLRTITAGIEGKRLESFVPPMPTTPPVDKPVQKRAKKPLEPVDNTLVEPVAAEPSHEWFEEVAVEVVSFAAKEWLPWTSRCSGCRALLRYRGVIGAVQPVACPRCGHRHVATMGSRQVLLGPAVS